MSDSTTLRLAAIRLFTGHEWLDHQVIEIEKGRVVRIFPRADHHRITLQVPIVAPGFVDLQINGAADVLFNDDPSARAIERIAWGARQGGTAHLLPTFITAPEGAWR